MAFFDKLGEKSKDVAQKAKDMKIVMGLNSQIANQKDIIKKTYSELGEAYFKDNIGNEESPYAELLNRISDAEEAIEKLNEQIKDIKGIQTCPNCGADLEDSDLFCKKCGTKLEPKPKVEEDNAEGTVNAFCSNCGAKLKDGVSFCGACGTKIEKVSDPIETIAEEEETLQEETVQSEEPAESSVQNDESDDIIVIEETIEVPEETEENEQLEATLENDNSFEPVEAEVEQIDSALEETIDSISETAEEEPDNVIEETQEEIETNAVEIADVEIADVFEDNAKPVCKNCGSELSEGALFCGECGTKVE